MEQYGIIGKPLGHSFSKEYFTEYFARTGRDACYLAFELEEISEMPALIAAHPDLVGFNVTLPYKQQIIPYLDRLDAAVTAIGAVNVVKVVRGSDNGRPMLIGYNTDHIGFSRSIRPLLQEGWQKALILGTGGASKAIAYALKGLDIDTTFVSRTPKEGQLGYPELTEETIRHYDIIVNCTPLGTFPNVSTCPDIPYEYLHSYQLCYDLVYNPEETLFMQRAARQGCTVCNGLQMLHIQADEAWQIWTAQ
jgi:shikimate dehydrogenase